MASQIVAHSSLTAKKISGHLVSLWARRTSPPPQLSSAEVCNFTLQRQTDGREENT